MNSKTLKTLALTAAAAALMMAAGAAIAQPPAAPAAAPAAPPAPPPALMPISPVLDAYNKAGPNKTVHAAEGPDCTVYRPETLAARTPIVLWSNGRGQTPDKYGTMLDQLASQGIVVAAANSGNAGAGVEVLACLDYLTTQNTTAGSAYMGKLDLTRVGAAGHSQGGGGTIMAGKDARIKTTAPIMPYTAAGLGFVSGAQAEQKGPMLLISGGADRTAPPATHQKPVFDSANVQVFWGTIANAVHALPATGDSGEVRPLVIAWMRAQLLGDRTAAALFNGPTCGLCSVPELAIQRKN